MTGNPEVMRALGGCSDRFCFADIQGRFESGIQPHHIRRIGNPKGHFPPGMIRLDLDSDAFGAIPFRARRRAPTPEPSTPQTGHQQFEGRLASRQQ